MTMQRRATAEFLGTFWLVFGGCGTAVFAAHAVGEHGVALAFGLTVLTMAYAIGHISGCHLNPAVTAGLVAGGRFKVSEVVPYVVAQVVGAIAAAGALKGMAASPGTLAANGFGDHSPIAAAGRAEIALTASGNVGYGAGSAFLIEALLTCFFVLIILGATDKRAPAGFAPIAMGAKPTGALPWVEPMMMKRNIIVSTTSAVMPAASEKPPGECSA